MRTVNHSGYLLNFLKFVDRPKKGSPIDEWKAIREEILNNKIEGENDRHVLRCLSQYDIFRFSAINDDIKIIDKVLNQKLSGYCIADRRFLCYSLSSDNNIPDVNKLFDGNDFLAVFLLKINGKLNYGSYAEENAAVDLFRVIIEKHFPGSLYWAFRSFANKEIFIMLKAEHLYSIENLVRILFRVQSHPGLGEKAFSVVKRWVCFNGVSLNDDSVFHGKLKLFGLCNHPNESKFVCLSGIPPETHDNRKICSSEVEAVKSICNISDGARTPLKVNEVVNSVSNFMCADVPHCSVSHSLLVHVDSIAGREKYSDVPFLFSDRNVVMQIGCDPASSLESVYERVKDFSEEGYKFHYIELRKITKYVLRKLRNEFEKSEYEDVMILLKNIYDRIYKVKIWIDNDEIVPGDRDRYSRQNIDILNSALPLLRYVCAERERPNLCSSWYDDGYYKSEISGFSKISNAASFLICRITNMPWNSNKTNYEGICTFGCLPSYKQHPFLGVVNTRLEAILAVKHHFGIFHEIGHLLLSYHFDFEEKVDITFNELCRVYPDCGIKLSLAKEIFADIYGHIYGVKNIRGYIRYFVVVLNDNIRFDMDIFSVRPEDIMSDAYREYIQKECSKIIYRLLGIVIADKYAFGSIEETLNYPDLECETHREILEALKEIRQEVKIICETRKDTTLILSLFQMIESTISDWLQVEPVQPENTLKLDSMKVNQKALFFIYSLCRRYFKYIFTKDNFKRMKNECWGENGYVNDIYNESKIYDENILYPQALINKAIELDNDIFSQNVATIVSLSANYNRSVFLKRFLN